MRRVWLIKFKCEYEKRQCILAKIIKHRRSRLLLTKLINFANKSIKQIFILDESPKTILWIPVVLAMAVLYPFLCGLGGVPEMDESSYIYISSSYNYALHNGQTLPPLLGMSLWPLLLSFIPDLPGNPLIWYRLADMLSAMLFGLIFCSCLQRISGHALLSLFLTLLILLCMTSRETMDNGFKNSYFPAWCCLWGSLLILQKHVNTASKRVLPFLMAGALVALGVLLRETLFPFAILGFLAVWKGWGFRPALFFSFGGIILTFILLGLIELLHHGNLNSFYKGYVDRSLFYKNEAGRIWKNIHFYGIRSLKLFSPALVFIAGCVSLAFLSKNSKRRFSSWQLLFWLCAFMLPLYEPILKYGFYYHFAMCLPGLGGLCALISRNISPSSIEATEKWGKYLMFVCGLICITGLLMTHALLPTPLRLANSLRFITGEGNWSVPEPSTSSTSLEAAEKIRHLLPEHGSLSVNGYAFMLYPLTGARPPWEGKIDPDDDFNMGDLGRFLTNINLNTARLEAALKNNPPDVIALTLCHGEHEQSYSREIAAVLENSGLYELVDKVEPDPAEQIKRHYGWLGYDIYRLKREKGSAAGKSM